MNVQPSNVGTDSAPKAQGFIEYRKSHRDQKDADFIEYSSTHRSKGRGAIIAIHADVLIVKPLPGPQAIDFKRGGGQRGTITEFSAAARKKMMLRLAQTVHVDNGVFVTLTYPAQFPTDKEKFKRDLDAMKKRLVRRLPNIGGFWRLEFQARGAPHYHLILFGVPGNVRNFRKWLAQAWYEVVASGDEKHLRAGTQADRIKNRAHAMRYATKYALKQDEGQDKEGDYGRRWGKFGNLDLSPSYRACVSMDHLIDLRRFVVAWLMHRVTAKGAPMRSARRYARRIKGAIRGFSIFGLGDMTNVPKMEDGKSSTVWRLVPTIIPRKFKASNISKGARDAIEEIDLHRWKWIDREQRKRSYQAFLERCAGAIA